MTFIRLNDLVEAITKVSKMGGRQISGAGLVTVSIVARR